MQTANRVLVLAERPAFPAFDGARLRVVSVLRALQDFRVDFVHLYEPGETFTPVEKILPHCITRASIEHDGRLTNWSRTRSVFSSLPNGALRLSCEGLHRALLVGQSTEYSFALVCGVNMTQYVRDLAVRKLYVDICDSEVRHMEVRRRFVSDPIRKGYFLLQGLKVTRHIRKTAGDVNAWFVISDVERASLASKFPDLDIRTIPNSIDLPCLASSGAHQPGLIVFSGNFEFFPNIDAAIHLVKRVLPILRRTLPEVRVRILGRNPSPEMLALRSDAVEITGLRNDFHSLLSEAAVYVCPLRLGTGVKNRVLEAMAAGLPVVSSAIGVEGIGCQAGLHYLEADGPTEFAAALTRVLRDPHLGRQLGIAARDYVAARFGPASIHTMLLKALHE